MLQDLIQPPPTFPPASVLFTKKTVLWPCDREVSVELRGRWRSGSVRLGHCLACSEERSKSSPPLGPVTPGEPPGKKPLKHLPCSFHSYNMSHVSGFGCGLTNPPLLDMKSVSTEYLPELGLSSSSSWTRKVYPERICLYLGLSWFCCWT